MQSMPSDRNPADVHRIDQIMAAFEDIPPEVMETLGEAIGGFVLALSERGVPMNTIAGGAHAVMAECLAPLIASDEQVAATTRGGAEQQHQHTWGSGLGESFQLGSVESHEAPGGGVLLQVCRDCGARRKVDS